MSKTSKLFLLILSAVLVLFTIGGGLAVKASSNQGAYPQLGVYSEVVSRIRSEYVEEPNMSAVSDGALHGLLESLDANSSYLNAAEYKQYREHKGEGKANIGATISKRFGYAAIVSVLPGGPADKAGISTGDIIEAIENRSSREMSLAEIESVLPGQVGSNINFSIVRARRAEPVKITVTRDLINIPPVADKMLDAGVGYIKVDALPKGKSQEIAGKIKSLQHGGAKKLILDLRNASDGDPAEGVAVANLFLDHGIVTFLQGQKHARETFNADPQKEVTTLPLVVLVNRGTAGAAEIVAGAILENGRGDVLGDKTFGMGSIQKLIDVPDGSALILTIAKYYTPGGKAIQDSAITPNILVADSDEDALLPDEDDSAATTDQEKKAAPKEDEQLKRAVEVLKAHA